MTSRRAFSKALCAAPAVLASRAQEAPADWSELWQPSLPARERHPFLFYDERDRERMKEHIAREPWKDWWTALSNSQARSSAPVRWWLTGDEEAARMARADLLERPIFRQQPQGYLEPSSHQLTDYAAAYDLLAAWPGLNAEDRRTIRDKIAAETDYYYGILSGPARGGANYGNQRTLGASAMGMAALALCEYKESPSGPEKWLRRALYEIRREENWSFFRADGHFIEGAGYTNYMDLQFLPFAIAYERASGKYLFEEPRLREHLTFAAYQMLASGDVIPWGTCEVQHGIAIFALVSNKRYGRDLAPLCAHAFSRSMRPHSLHLHIAMAQVEDGIPGALPEASRVFPGSHLAVFRDNWGSDCAAVWFGGKESGWGLPNRYRSYSHGDCGHFVVAMADEVLAADSGYDHWASRDYYDATFHNVILIDGKGPDSFTTGAMSDYSAEGPVRHASVAAQYQGCSVRRKLALVRGRYVVVADRVVADAEHDYAWQVRSTCPPEAPGTRLGKREVVWPGLAANGWRELKPGRTQLTTVVPPFASLSLEKGRWRPISSRPEFANQVAVAKWRAADTWAMFVLIPNLRERPDVTWRDAGAGTVAVDGPGWSDTMALAGGELRIQSRDGAVAFRRPL